MPAHHGLQACVALLCEVEAYDDAVSLALTFDRGLAEDVARRPADDSTRRQLWLAIAKHLFAGASEVCIAKETFVCCLKSKSCGSPLPSTSSRAPQRCGHGLQSLSGPATS